jgi:hypothetical protein
MAFFLRSTRDIGTGEELVLKGETTPYQLKVKGEIRECHRASRTVDDSM